MLHLRHDEYKPVPQFLSALQADQEVYQVIYIWIFARGNDSD